jgi:hypothetical protein
MQAYRRHGINTVSLGHALAGWPGGHGARSFTTKFSGFGVGRHLHMVRRDGVMSQSKNAICEKIHRRGEDTTNLRWACRVV